MIRFQSIRCNHSIYLLPSPRYCCALLRYFVCLDNMNHKRLISLMELIRCARKMWATKFCGDTTRELLKKLHITVWAMLYGPKKPTLCEDRVAPPPPSTPLPYGHALCIRYWYINLRQRQLS